MEAEYLSVQPAATTASLIVVRRKLCEAACCEWRIGGGGQTSSPSCAQLSSHRQTDELVLVHARSFALVV
jgi:hypothetical protein